MCLCAVVDTARYAVAALCKEERAHTHILQAEAKEIALHGPFRKTQERERRVQETKQLRERSATYLQKQCTAVLLLHLTPTSVAVAVTRKAGERLTLVLLIDGDNELGRQ